MYKYIYLLIFIYNIFFCYSQNIPNQVHIALAGKNNKGLVNTMAISWSTINNTEQHLVKYGIHPGDYTLSSKGYSKQYYKTYHHHVVLSPSLAPNTRYYYIVGDEIDGFSEEFTFLSSNNEPDKPVTFLVYGDLGVWYSNDTMTYIKKEVDFKKKNCSLF